jgi:hypothetical protein
MYNKTLVSCDHHSKKPDLIKRIAIKLWNGKLCYNKTKRCWEEKYVVKGYIERGWFYPNFMESITYIIFWPYGQKDINFSDFLQYPWKIKHLS